MEHLSYAPDCRLAIVTGAASGLGRAFCRQLAASGQPWRLVAADVDAAGVAETLDSLPRGQITAEFAPLDVADYAAWQDLHDRLRGQWSRLDLLVNNAGVCMAGEVGEGPIEPWRRVHAVNFLGVLNGCQVMTPWLKQSVVPGAGLRPAVINVASIAAVFAAPAMGAYCASKAAVLALTEAMHAELRPHGVHATVVMPGFFRSRLLERGHFAVRRHLAQAEKLTRRATIDADAVARAALRAAERGRLYAVLGARARWLWRWKRALPNSAMAVVSRSYRRTMLRSSD
jgi:NAD(P)-dependent dehydrogenase (short-subunit alcohol dehydrogenase family)